MSSQQVYTGDWKAWQLPGVFVTLEAVGGFATLQLEEFSVVLCAVQVTGIYQCVVQVDVLNRLSYLLSFSGWRASSLLFCIGLRAYGCESVIRSVCPMFCSATRYLNKCLARWPWNVLSLLMVPRGWTLMFWWPHDLPLLGLNFLFWDVSSKMQQSFQTPLILMLIYKLCTSKVVNRLACVKLL